MADLQDHQFELDGYAFGFGLPHSVDEEGFDNGSAEWKTQDGEGYGTGATLFGRDVLTGPTWAWNGFADGASESEALSILAAAGRAWRNRAGRGTPGAFSTLRYAVGGRTRRVYGRPRRFSGPPNNKILSGYVPIVSDFKCADALHYDDVEQVMTVRGYPSDAGGLASPLVGPLTTVMRTDGGPNNVADIGGDEDTPLILTFRGPSLNAWVSINGVRVCELNGSLLGGQNPEELVVDARPWVNAATKGGLSANGMLGRRTFFDRMRFSPGPVVVEYGAIDATGTSRVEVRWRTAWSTL